MIGRKPRVLTPEENRARNIQRILNPPKLTWWERAKHLPLRVESWWWKRRHPELTRLLVRARLDLSATVPHEHDDECRYMR